MITCLVDKWEREWEVQWRARDEDCWVSMAVFRDRDEATRRFVETTDRKGVAGQFRLMEVTATQIKVLYAQEL